MKNKNLITGIIILMVLVGGYFIFSGNGVGTDYGDNGIWDATTHQCLPREESGTFFQCCFNYEGQQVDCRNASKPLGVSPLAIYKGTPGIGSVSQGIKITNTGNVDFSAQLESFTWTANPTSSVTFLNNAWNSVKGVSKSIPQGTYQSWSTPLINVQSGCPTTSITYTIKANAKATTTIDGVSYSSASTKTSSFTCQKESISFDFDINF